LCQKIDTQKDEDAVAKLTASCITHIGMYTVAMEECFIILTEDHWSYCIIRKLVYPAYTAGECHFLKKSSKTYRRSPRHRTTHMP